MKNIKYIIVTALLLLSVTGCEVLDKEPLDVISDAIVWNDATLVDTYLANVYFETDLSEQRQERYGVNMAMVASMGGEGRSYGGHHQPYRAATRAITSSDLNWALDFWPYKNIRDANFLIEKLENESTLDADLIVQRVAETRFLRAHMYFQMVIRFGGIPLITEVQGIDATEAELSLLVLLKKRCMILLFLRWMHLQPSCRPHILLLIREDQQDGLHRL